MKLRIGHRFGVVVALMAAALLVMAAGSLWQLRISLMDGKQQMARAVVEAAVSIAERFQAAVEAGTLAPDDARSQALAALRALRYEGDNYVWVNDRQPVLLMHPVRSDLEGQDVSTYRDPNGKHIFVEFVNVAEAEDSGFVFYHWPKPGTVEPERKVSYVALFRPWGWVIGTGLYVGDVERMFMDRASHFGLFVAFVVACAIILSMGITRSITLPLDRITALTVRLSKGDNTIEVPHTGDGDEIADLACALQVFKENARKAEEFQIAREDEQHRAAEDLRASEARVRLLLDSTGEGIYGIGLDGKCTIANPAAAKILGYDSAEELLARDAHALMHHHRADGTHYPSFQCPVHVCIETGRSAHVADEVFFRADGTSFPVEYRAHTIRRNGVIIGAVVNFADITERRRAEDEMKVARTVFNTTTDGIMVTDFRNRIKTVNPAFERLTGYSLAEVAGETPAILASGKHDPEFYAALWQSLVESGHWQGQIWNRRKSGDLYAEWLTITTIRDKSGEPTEFVAIFSDITSRAHAADQIRHEANYDPLTELPNRRHMDRKLTRLLDSARSDGRQLALLFVDLDRFKPVNDTLGHEIGDKLLIEVAGRLKSCVRNSDVVARVGGDEFIVILDNFASPLDGSLVAAKIVEAIDRIFVIEDQSIHIGASIGVALFPLHGHDARTLIQQADAAMYKAKSAGRSTFEMAEEF